MTVASLVAVFGVAALALDGAYWYERRAEAQRVADCAAITAAYAGSLSGLAASHTAFKNAVSKSNYDSTDITNNYIITPYKGKSHWYHVHVGRNETRIFSGVLGLQSPEVGAAATAQGLTYGNNANLPQGAIVGNNNVTFVGNANTTVASGAVSNANVYANGVVFMNGNTSVQGTINVAPAGYASSVGNVAGNALYELATPVVFPDASTISEWQSGWYAAASSTGNIINNYAKQTSGFLTITAPAVINGSIDMSGQSTLTINPSPNSTSSVLYVTGSITTSGGATLINNGVIIVSVGDITSSGDATSTGGTSSLISLSTDDPAITLNGNAGDDIGLVYAVNGGTVLNGNGNITGSLLSGSSTGQIKFNGNANLIYPNGLNNNEIFPIPGGLIATSTQGLD